MILIDLWTEYLSKTMPSLTAGGVPLVVIQMLCGLPPLVSLYRAVRRDSAGERVLLCMVPGIFIVSLSIVEPLFFDSFLGNGFPWAEALKRFLYQSRFFEEIVVLVWAFLVAAALSWMAQRWDGYFSLKGFLLSTGIGLFTSAVILILSIDYFVFGGRLFPMLDGQMVKWLVYGIYLLFYHLCVLLVCLLWRFLFSERKGIGVDKSYRRWLRRYMSRSYRACGWGFLMFAALWTFSVVWGLYREGSPYSWALMVNVVIAAIGIGCMVFSVIQPNYRRIMTWGDPEKTSSQIYQELIEKEPLIKTDIGFLTEHYLVTSAPKRIFCRELLVPNPAMDVMGAYTLRFRDGGRCRINRCYRLLLEPLLAVRKDEP